jgi:alkylation response protein AidB-like acyl-CoA dehydrogenase
VLFDNYKISGKYRLDDVGAGWKVAMTTLTHERGAGELVNPASGGMAVGDESAVDTSSVDGLIGLAKAQFRNEQSAADDPAIRDEIMQLYIRDAGRVQTTRRSMVPALNDHPTRLPLQSKVVNTEINQDIAKLAYEIEGAYSTLSMADSNAPANGKYPNAYMNSFGNTIAAGTSEVQRNILGERVLGLPKSK